MNMIRDNYFVRNKYRKSISPCSVLFMLNYKAKVKARVTSYNLAGRETFYLSSNNVYTGLCVFFRKIVVPLGVIFISKKCMSFGLQTPST